MHTFCAFLEILIYQCNFLLFFEKVVRVLVHIPKLKTQNFLIPKCAYFRNADHGKRKQHCLYQSGEGHTHFEETNLHKL